jgi:hypothetical protein
MVMSISVTGDDYTISSVIDVAKHVTNANYLSVFIRRGSFSVKYYLSMTKMVSFFNLLPFLVTDWPCKVEHKPMAAPSHDREINGAARLPAP